MNTVTALSECFKRDKSFVATAQNDGEFNEDIIQAAMDMSNLSRIIRIENEIEIYDSGTVICTCTAMPEMLHAQDDSLKKDSTERPFNAMDYVLQKRYIPQGREVNNSQPGKNFSLSVMGGVNKLRGSSSLPAWFNGGIALTKDVSSFNSYRVSLLGRLQR